MVTTDFTVAGARTAFWPVTAGASPYDVKRCVIADPQPQSGSPAKALHWIVAELNAALSDEASRAAGAYVTPDSTLCADSYFLALNSLSIRMKEHASQCSSFGVDRRWLLSEQLMVLVALWQSASHHRIGLTTGAMTIAMDAPQILFLPVASQLLACPIVAKSAYAEGSLPNICSYKVPVISIASIETGRVPLASRADLSTALYRLQTVLCWNRTLEKVIDAAKSSLHNHPIQGFNVPVRELSVNYCGLYYPLIEDRLEKPKSDLFSRMKKATQSSIIVFYDDSFCGETHGVEPTANLRPGSAQRNAEAWPATGDELAQHPETAPAEQNGSIKSDGRAFSLDAHQGVSFSKDNLHSVFLGKRKLRTCDPH